MSATDYIQRHGFRRWYERQLIESHAYLALGFVALLWMILLLGQGLDLEQFGVRPRDWHGLVGILAAPLLHGGFKHLLDNSIPLVVVGTAMLYLYPKS